MRELRENGLFCLLSGLSAGSLLVVGAISLTLSIYTQAAAGILISLAICGHGWMERLLRRRALRGEELGLRLLALNQLGLAASVSLYLGYQALNLDIDALYALALNPPVANALALYPDELRLRIMDALPFLAGLFYVIAAAATWIACLATSIYYWRCRRRSE